MVEFTGRDLPLVKKALAIAVLTSAKAVSVGFRSKRHEDIAR